MVFISLFIFYKVVEDQLSYKLLHNTQQWTRVQNTRCNNFKALWRLQPLSKKIYITLYAHNFSQHSGLLTHFFHSNLISGIQSHNKLLFLSNYTLFIHQKTYFLICFFTFKIQPPRLSSNASPMKTISLIKCNYEIKKSNIYHYHQEPRLCSI